MLASTPSPNQHECAYIQPGEGRSCDRVRLAQISEILRNWDGVVGYLPKELPLRCNSRTQFYELEGLRL